VEPSAEKHRPVPPFQTDFSADVFTGRRRQVISAIGSGVALLRGAPATGAFDLFRQFNDFYYLCGVEVPVAYLLIDGAAHRSMLFLAQRDPKHERSEGAQLAAEDADLIAALTGIDETRSLEDLPRMLGRATTVFLPFAPAEGRQACRDTLRYARTANGADPLAAPAAESWLSGRVREIAPSAEIRDLSPILDGLREIKGEQELRLMARAGRLSALAVCAAMRATCPGAMEYQLAAVAEYVFLVNGARGDGYRPIVASGRNIWNAHYYRNNCRLAAEDLVLLDYAPDCGNYTSDIGRIWPVNGRYSPLHRELYGFVVEYHKILLRLIRPGVTTEQIVAEAHDSELAVVQADLSQRGSAACFLSSFIYTPRRNGRA
jgi:Xaa-Pro aminopeptidase